MLGTNDLPGGEAPAPMQACGRNQMISSSASQGVVSGEFATGNGLTSSTAPMISNLFPAGANLASTGEVLLWGYVCDPMRLSRRGRGTHAMVATLKRPPPGAALRDQKHLRSAQRSHSLRLYTSMFRGNS